MSSAVYIIRCNDATEFIVDMVAYDSSSHAERVRDEMDASGFNTACGPHGIYTLRLIKESD
jgi:hypothetical protein